MDELCAATQNALSDRGESGKSDVKPTEYLSVSIIGECVMRVKHLAALILIAPLTLGAQTTARPVFRASGAFFAISVPDLDAAAAWYADRLGLNVALRPPPYEGIRAVILDGGGLIVELIHNPASQPPPTPANPTQVQGLFKVGIVVDSLDATLSHLRARGVAIAYGPYAARPGQRANFIIRDTAGTLIQFFGR